MLKNWGGNQQKLGESPFLPLDKTLLIPAWISNYMPIKVWDEITYPFPNFNGCTIIS